MEKKYDFIIRRERVWVMSQVISSHILFKFLKRLRIYPDRSTFSNRSIDGIEKQSVEHCEKIFSLTQKTFQICRLKFDSSQLVNK
jgi:hypothetical protein